MKISLTNSHKPPEILLPWLCESGSLTAKFEALSGQDLIIKKIKEGFVNIDRESARLLLPTKHALLKPHSNKKLSNKPMMAWVREVELQGNDKQPWAVAKSIFPITALQGKAKRLRHLGKTPLGYILFGRHSPSCQRIITQNIINNEVCFTRQNYYTWHGKIILVQETFLPNFVQRLQQKSDSTIDSNT